MSYFDVDDILADEDLLPCTFLIDAEGLGYLEGSGNVDARIESGREVPLPLWLAKPLWLSGEDYISVGTPKMYGTRRRDDLNADPNVVSLNSSPYYYSVGRALAEIQADEDLLQLLLETFNSRFLMLADKAYNWRDEDASTVTENTTLCETQLFNAGMETAADFRKWKNRHLEKLTAARKSGSRTQGTKRPRES